MAKDFPVWMKIMAFLFGKKSCSVSKIRKAVDSFYHHTLREINKLEKSKKVKSRIIGRERRVSLTKEWVNFAEHLSKAFAEVENV